MTRIKFPIPDGPTLKSAQDRIECLNRIFAGQTGKWSLGASSREGRQAYIEVVFHDNNDAVLAKALC
jgi:hypothetical protein